MLAHCACMTITKTTHIPCFLDIMLHNICLITTVSRPKLHQLSGIKPCAQ